MTPIPEVPQGGNIAIYIWIIGVLIVLVPSIIIFYERKNKAITDRLNTVIDDSIKRMESSNDNDKNGIQKINDIVVKLREMIILINR